MKHIWYILEDEFELKEGYITELCNYNPDFNPDPLNLIDTLIYDERYNLKDGVNHEYIFDNKETAENIFKGMLDIELKKVYDKIESLTEYGDNLLNKLKKL